MFVSFVRNVCVVCNMYYSSTLSYSMCRSLKAPATTPSRQQYAPSFLALCAWSEEPRKHKHLLQLHIAHTRSFDFWHLLGILVCYNEGGARFTTTWLTPRVACDDCLSRIICVKSVTDLSWNPSLWCTHSEFRTVMAAAVATSEESFPLMQDQCSWLSFRPKPKHHCMSAPKLICTQPCWRKLASSRLRPENQTGQSLLNTCFIWIHFWQISNTSISCSLTRHLHKLMRLLLAPPVEMIGDHLNVVVFLSLRYAAWLRALQLLLERRLCWPGCYGTVRIRSIKEPRFLTLTC